jgi:hypothetical protein
LKCYLKKAAAWMKQNPQTKITRYQMGRLIGVAWNRAASVSVGVSTFESTGIYPLNSSRVPEHFSISDTSESTTCMETAPRNMAPISAPSASGTISKTVLSTPVGPSTSNLNTIMFSDTSPDVITPYKRLRKISQTPRRNLTATSQLASVLTEAANIKERRNKQRGSEVKEQRKMAKVNILNTSGLQRGKILRKKKSKRKKVLIKKLKILTPTSAVSARKTSFEQQRKMTGSSVCVAETGYMSPALSTKTNASIAAEICCERKIASRSEYSKFH